VEVGTGFKQVGGEAMAPRFRILTTFRKGFILKRIAVGQAQSAEVYGRIELP
jgi:hypothetical protein